MQSKTYEIQFLHAFPAGRDTFYFVFDEYSTTKNIQKNKLLKIFGDFSETFVDYDVIFPFGDGERLYEFIFYNIDVDCTDHFYIKNVDNDLLFLLFKNNPKFISKMRKPSEDVQKFIYENFPEHIKNMRNVTVPHICVYKNLIKN